MLGNHTPIDGLESPPSIVVIRSIALALLQLATLTNNTCTDLYGVQYRGLGFDF